MKANWILLLFLCLISVSESCLVVRTKECACHSQMLDYDNLSIVSDHPFYGNLTKHIITEPTVTGDKCSISIFCGADYDLVVLDKQTTSNFGQYSADGTCQVGSQTWLVSDDAGFKTFQIMNAVCVSFKAAPVCTPGAPTTFLLALSNDMGSETFQSLYNVLWLYYRNRRWERFEQLGSIRFDLEEEEDIKYNNDYFEWLDAWYSYRPNASLSLSSPNKTDVFKAINKHFLTTKAPVCGTRITIIMGRPLPKSTSLEIVSRFQKYNISLFTISPASKDNVSSVISTIAGMTEEGYGVDWYRERSALDSVPAVNLYLCIYKEIVEISGTGELILPRMTVSAESSCFSVFSSSIYFDETTVLVLKWNSIDSPNSEQMNTTGYFAVANANSDVYSLNAGIFDMKLVYAVSKPQTVNIGFYIV